MSIQSELDIFSGLLKQLINGSVKAELRWVTAKEIDWTEKTMTATDVDELPYTGVLLGLGSHYIKPKVNTDCLIAIVEGQETVAFMLFADEVDQICFNGEIVFNAGENGGLVKIKELTSKLNALTSSVNALVASYNTHVHVTTATVGASVVPGVLSPIAVAAQTAKPFNKSDFENTKITH